MTDEAQGEVPVQETSPDVETAQQAQPEANWREALPQEYRDKYSEYKDPIDFVKGYDSLVQKLGKNPIVKPPDDAPDDKKEEYKKTLYKELGWPDKKEEYGVEVPDAMKGYIDDGMLNNVMDVMHRNGASKELVQQVMSTYFEGQQKELAELEARFSPDNIKAQLQEKWGDQTDEKIKAVDLYLESFANKGALEKYKNDPEFLVALDEMRTRYKEDSTRAGKANDAPFDPKAEMFDLMKSKEYNDVNAVGHERVRARVRQLIKDHNVKL